MKYDSAFKADGNGNLLLRLEAALVAPLRDIDARLSALEAAARERDAALLAQAHNDLAKRAARALGDQRVCVSSDDKPAPTAPATREPGWYWAWFNDHHGYVPTRFDGEMWRSPIGEVCYPGPIGSRIEVPKP